MITRLIEKDDVDRLYAIWKKFYRNDFPFPLSSQRKQLDRYVITDDNDQILLLGMIELYPEINTISNLDANLLDRREAYHFLLQQLEKDSLHYGMRELYCSVKGNNWERHIKRMGFGELNSKMLVKRLK